MELPLLGDTYQSVSTALVNRRCINLYQQIPESPARSKMALINCPGLSQFISMGDKVCRGMIEASGRGFAVYNNVFYEVFSNGTKTNHGTVSGIGNVKMAYNGFVIVIVTSSNGYFFDLATDTLTVISDTTYTSFGTVTDVTYKNGFFVYMTSTYIFNGSVLTTDDGKTFSGLSFGSAELEPDGNVAIFNLNNQMYVLGENTIESFRTVGGSNFPFSPIPGASIQKGCIARDSVCEFAGLMTFLGKAPGETPALYTVQGSQYNKISTPAIEEYIQSLSLSEQQDAICWVYQAGGSPFLVLEVGNATFIYDAESSRKSGMNRWHERQTGAIDWNGYKLWNARFSMNVFGEILIGDPTGAKLGKLEYDLYTEYGNRIPRGWTSQPFDLGDTGKLLRLELTVESGVGNSTITNPRIEMAYSDDQGRTWSTGQPKEMGEVGNYTQRLVWRRLGDFDRDRTLRFYTDDPAKIAMIRLEAEIG